MKSILRLYHFYGFEFHFKVFNSFLGNVTFLRHSLFIYKLRTLVANSFLSAQNSTWHAVSSEHLCFPASCQQKVTSKAEAELSSVVDASSPSLYSQSRTTKPRRAEWERA